MVSRSLPGLAALPLGASVLLAGCMAHAPVSDGCGSDKDCKVDRVCEANLCVWPKRPAAATAPTAAWGEQPPAEAGPPAQGMFRFDPRHRGRSSFLLPKQKPEILWTVE